MKERKINIEFIRVFAIIMTVMIHVSNLYLYSYPKISNDYYLITLIFNCISRICVPLFFMVSGIFLINEEFDKKKYFKRIKKFILLLVVWSIIYFLIKNFNSLSWNKVLNTFVNSFYNADYTSKHLWFMYAIIGLYIALPFIQNMCKGMDKYQENLFLILWVCFSGLISIVVPISRGITHTSVDISYPIPIINAAYYLGYFVAGHILYERFKNYKVNRKVNLICLFTYILSTLIMISVTYILSVNKHGVFDSMLWYRSIFTIISSASIFILIVMNEGSFKSKFILKLSKLSFGVYLLHDIFVIFIKGNINIINYNPLIIPIVTLIIYLISLLFVYVLNKIPILKKLVS